MMEKQETDFQKQYREQLLAEEQEELASNQSTINSFTQLCAGKGLNLSKENFNFFRTTGIIAVYPNLLTYLFPDLVLDKEGLYDFGDLTSQFERKRFANGYLYSKDCMLMAHPHFRRSYHPINNFAPRFIEFFWNFSNPQVETHISLDPDRVRINVDDSTYMELDTWFGAKFDKNIAGIPDGMVKLRPPSDIDSGDVYFFFANVYCLDICWETKKGVKSFEAEEFKTEDIKITKDGKEYYPVRYVHAEYDLAQEYFRHFDGAIHFYTSEEYFSRRDSDLNYNAKHNHHIKAVSEKLFKMNGIISVEVWIDFVSHFLTGNPLVFEYFEGVFPPHTLEILEKIRNR